MKEIVINGITYERIEIPENKEKRYTKSGMIMAQMLAFGGLYVPSTKDESNKLPFMVDIEKEFELIQQKKSQLPRSTRDKIVYNFFKLYREKK